MIRYGGLEQEHSRILVSRSMAFLFACSTRSSWANMVSAFSWERDGAAVKSLKMSNESRAQSCVGVIVTDGVVEGVKPWLSSGAKLLADMNKSRFQSSRGVDEPWGMKKEVSSEL